MPGHVFVVRADIRKLACDAWLMPCSRSAEPQGYWFLDDYKGPRTGTPFQDGGSRTQPLIDVMPNVPQPWLTWSGARKKEVKWYVDGAHEFIEKAAEAIANAGSSPLFGRAKSLLALPVIGTGQGGAAKRAGEVVQELLPRLEQLASKPLHGREFDIALVCWDMADYAAAQAERVRRGTWPTDLPETLRKEADKITEPARKGELALFLGAGVSMAAGLPNWAGLLQALAKSAGLSSEECRALSGLRNATDQATIIERRLQEKNLNLGQVVKDEFASRKHYALAHALLAALPVREVITTNYDQLFDEAWKLTDAEGLSVLPGTLRPNTRRWLLKMHGCLSKPDRIVLTRESYNRYDEHLPCLSEIVRTFLVMRHMLFVGFSLTDDNFHRIVDTVRRLRNSVGATNQFGTTLTLGHGGLSEVLWDRELNRVRMDEREESGAFPYGEMARRLEIFLDYLLSRTRNTAHLLVGQRFDTLLNEGERMLRDALDRFAKEMAGTNAEAIKKTVAWPQIEQLLVSLGYKAPR